jgi:hypothetical protein
MDVIDFFEEGKSRRFLSCDKAANELLVLLEAVTKNPDEQLDVCIKFWTGYRWNPPETKQKTMRS